MEEIKKIYISGPLTHSDKKEIYEKIANICKSVCGDVYVPHLGGTDPIKNPEVDASVVWHKDHREVSSSDLLVAYVGEPSLGVGAEMEIARITETKIILWWFRGEKVSRMALGNPAVISKLEVLDEEDLYKKIKQELKKYY